jgi:pre-mRNA-splicing factor 18
MDVLKAAINQAKKTQIAATGNRFLKRSEIEKIKQEQEATEKEAKKVARDKRVRGEAGTDEEALGSKRQKMDNDKRKTQDDDENGAQERNQIEPHEVMRKLRGYGQPITFFGESDNERLERLKTFELKAHESREGSAGRRNLFDELMKQDVEKELQDAMLMEMEKQKATDPDSLEASEAKIQQEKRMKAAEHAKKQAEKYLQDKTRQDFDHTEDYILHFFKRLIKEWEIELDSRPVEEKRSEMGKRAHATQKQTRQWIRPFFKLLKTRTVTKDVMTGTLKITDFCRRREYNHAREAYLTLAIGNAAWPMGVTMVGIHERSGREKIYSQNTAHVLNDEGQRKYIQAVKRLMSYCEEKNPPFKTNV